MVALDNFIGYKKISGLVEDFVNYKATVTLSVLN